MRDMALRAFKQNQQIFPPQKNTVLLLSLGKSTDINGWSDRDISCCSPGLANGCCIRSCLLSFPCSSANFTIVSILSRKEPSGVTKESTTWLMNCSQVIFSSVSTSYKEEAFISFRHVELNRATRWILLILVHRTISYQGYKILKNWGFVHLSFVIFSQLKVYIQ